MTGGGREETVYISERNHTATVYHTDPDCSIGPKYPKPLSKAEATDEGRRCCDECKYADVPALEDHDERESEFMRQQGLGGSLGRGQATLDGGIRPSDRGQVIIWPVVLLSAVGLAVLTVAITVGVL